ncbi:MAG: 30S ribosomal protein S4 [Candidatus Wallbacteria bacterium]|nr:30S ribosomal protein S4 [Candidatus Wallbacteria bacterium]
MARYIGPSCRQCRRIGEKLFLKGKRCYSDKCAIDRKRLEPGASKGHRRKKLSDYGMQLIEKQKVKKIYGLLEKQFHSYYVKAAAMPGVTGHSLLGFLEKRLDNVLFRAGFAVSRTQSRQFVRHGQVTVNGKKVNIPSFQVRVGDVVMIKDKFRQCQALLDAVGISKGREVPEWMRTELEQGRVTIAREPQRSDIGANINESTVVEFYSK